MWGLDIKSRWIRLDQDLSSLVFLVYLMDMTKCSALLCPMPPLHPSSCHWASAPGVQSNRAIWSLTRVSTALSRNKPFFPVSQFKALAYWQTIDQQNQQERGVLPFLGNLSLIVDLSYNSFSGRLSPLDLHRLCNHLKLCFVFQILKIILNCVCGGAHECSAGAHRIQRGQIPLDCKLLSVGPGNWIPVLWRAGLCS